MPDEDAKKSGHLAGYRVTPKKLKHLWTHKDHRYSAMHHLPTLRGGQAFLRAFPRSDTMLRIDLATGKLLAKTRGSGTGSSGYHFFADGRVWVQEEASHSRTEFHIFEVKPDAFEYLGYRWDAPHATTSAYYPILMNHAFVDGRLIIRGARGLFCYDLRQTE